MEEKLGRMKRGKRGLQKKSLNNEVLPYKPWRKNVVIKKALLLGLSVVMVLTNTKIYAAEETENTTQNLEEEVDAFFNEKMQEYSIPGAAVVVVDHGEVVVEKAYGFSDGKEQKAFDKDTTFRIASITKTFTATALMQLVEQGKVDLEADIRQYLPTLKIKNPYDVSVTVKDLLNYTSGIDSSCLEELSIQKIDMPNGFLLKEMNKKNLTVIRKPGTHIAYCSYGVILEGCIIEAISGESCEDYIEEHILQPLDMTKTAMTMEDENLSKGYVYAENQVKEYTMKGYFKLYPEGGLLSSLTDMSHYLQMFLQKGRYQGNTLLTEESVKAMLTQSISYDELLPGMCYGFSEYESQGVRLVGHGGYAPDGFLSQIDLYPQYDSGTFVIVNQGSNNDIANEFRAFYIDRMHMEANAPMMLSSNDDQTAYNIEGSYRFSDYSKTTLCKGDAFGGVGEVTVKKQGKNEILLSGMDEFTGKKYSYQAQKMDATHYRMNEEGRTIVFLTKGEKVVGMAMTDDCWHGYYEKLHWYEAANVQMPVLVVAILLYLACILVLPIRHIIRKIRKKSVAVSTWDRTRHMLQFGISFMNAGFLIYSLYNWGDRLRYRIPWDIKVNLTMPIIGFTGMLVLLFMTGMEFIQKKGTWKKRIFDVVFLILSILYSLLLMYWRLFGFQY